MLATKSVSLSCISRKLSTLTCFFLLAGLGESCFFASANAQTVAASHLIQAKSELSPSKKPTSFTDSKIETVVASESVDKEPLEGSTKVHDVSSEEVHDFEDDSALEPEASLTPSQELAKKIIAELNRVRTDPQAYADWLESQKQHYQGMILNFPGEQSVRTNRGLRTLNEAIAFVRAQQPLPALTDSEELLTNAADQVEAIINQQRLDHHTNNLVYNRVTPEAIVMQLVVDDGFPDRRHRLAVFQEDYQHTGIVCQEIEVYNQICAIAYENKPLEIIQDSSVQVASNQSSTSRSASANSDVASNSQSNSVPEKIVETQPSAIVNPPSSSLPAPPPAPPAPPVATANNNSQTTVAEKTNSPTPADTQAESKAESVPDSAIATNPVAKTDEASSPENPTNKDQQVAAAVEKPNENAIAAVPTQPQKAATETKAEATKPETTTEPEVVAAANTVKPAQVAEIVESGVLEEGDEIVPNDGSFYDSFPLEGSAGDSFSISLESQDFDTFLAVMDPEGNIIEKNDDIDDQTSNSRLEITLPDTGSYSVIVNAYDEGGKGKYTLKVTE